MNVNWFSFVYRITSRYSDTSNITECDIGGPKRTAFSSQMVWTLKANSDRNRRQSTRAFVIGLEFSPSSIWRLYPWSKLTMLWRFSFVQDGLIPYLVHNTQIFWNVCESTFIDLFYIIIIMQQWDEMLHLSVYIFTRVLWCVCVCVFATHTCTKGK